MPVLQHRCRKSASALRRNTSAARGSSRQRQTNREEKMELNEICKVAVVALALTGLAAAPAAAQKKYDPGASDTEIKIGNTTPYSGPASAYGVIGKTETAYFNKVNAEGGINGRKINFISYDDGYSPPKT